MPSQGRTTLPFSRICWTTHLIVFAGMANPTPWAKGIIAVLIPITLPLMSASGPPLFPGLIAVSVWIRPSKMKSAPGKGRPRHLSRPWRLLVLLGVLESYRLRVLSVPLSGAPSHLGWRWDGCLLRHGLLQCLLRNLSLRPHQRMIGRL